MHQHSQTRQSPFGEGPQLWLWIYYSTLCGKFPWTNILIQPEEVIWVIVRLYRNHAVPSFLIRLRHAILLIAAHKIYIDAGFHRWPKFIKESVNPGNIVGIGGCFRPVR